ncbi:hypothetical protein DAD63_08355 [Streptococcus agalactiae]|uniref:Uncharacterized protein n=2 Tax=Streptococcus agalactiae TaxID=1311 RepID=Q8DYE5_STRA5|nr:hypothetical protein SAG1539 [Streptococcus agalactiae 2603V/R]ATZ83321.1 hypothetical protein CWQ22_07465 [Streptococcus agalactiae]AVH83472.1 hypothetical protein A6J68_11450 [Streptococcus sp. 'group B']AYY68266.1 hypothetical protein EGX72_04410 [Streptococcus sp. FDAARGOS_521]AYZ04043.1 hypothetical protein EGX96_01865 [Streptococcus sp. FDAARGOS_520]
MVAIQYMKSVNFFFSVCNQYFYKSIIAMLRW